MISSERPGGDHRAENQQGREAPARPRPARRAFLVAGAALLLPGCTIMRAAPPAALPSPRRSAAPSPAPPAPTPAATAAGWQPATPARPVPGVCPGSPGVLRKPGNPLQYLPCEGTNIALTIDDGPDPEWTPQVLALLAHYDIRATFCMIGRSAAANPRLVAAVADGGHHIANHTFTHPLDLTILTPAQVSAEIGRASDAITSASGAVAPRLFRAPGGSWSLPVISAAAAAGMRPLDWSVDPRDWSLPGVEHIVDTILANTHPGSIILDHDGGGPRQQTVDAMKLWLPRLLDAGYRFAQP
jgi:peptidoglycan-N-acetylglucosamine deacetylase